MELLQQNLTFLGVKNTPEQLCLQDLEAICKQHDITLPDLLLFNLSATHLPWEKVKFIFLDVDGVLTEGGMHYTEKGDEFKRFDTKDGMAIKVGMEMGLKFGIISSGVNQAIIEHRAAMFGIKHVYVGTAPKIEIANSWLAELGLDWNETAHIGDDINDLKIFEKVAIAACPADAVTPIKKAAHFVLNAKGGFGCVRNFLSHHPALKEKL